MWLMLGNLLGCFGEQEVSKSSTEKMETIFTTDQIPIHKQVVLVEIDSWTANTGRLSRFEWAIDKGWISVGETMEVVIGREGLAWGIGLYDIPLEEGETLKIEGDYRSPAGIFSLSGGFGTARNHMIKWNFPYRESNQSYKCITDSNSMHYNKIIHDKKVNVVDWTSFHELRGQQNSYKWGITVDHNPKNIKDRGSCVFMHTHSFDGSGTAVGTGLSERDIIQVLPWLQSTAKPILVQGSAEGMARLLGVLKKGGVVLPKENKGSQ